VSAISTSAIDPHKPSSKVYFKSIFGLAVGIRLFIVLIVLISYPKDWLYRAHGEVNYLAESLLAGNGFSSPWGGATGPTAFMTPGYPALIATIFSFFGSFTQASAAVIMLLQTAFAMITIFVVISIANREFGAKTANIAGFFWAVALTLIWMPVVFWDTSLSILLLAASLDISLRCVGANSFVPWAGMGLIGSLTLWVNPSFALMLLGLFLWTGWTARRQSFRRPLAALVLLLVTFGPWPIRNARLLHAFIPLRSNLGFELWKGNRPDMTGLDDDSVYPPKNPAEYRAYATLGEVAYMRIKNELAMQEIKARPGEFVRLTLRRFVNFWEGAGSPENSPILILHESLTSILSLAGLAWLIRERRISLAVLFALPLLLFPLPYYIVHAEIRFRILIEPATSILAAYAVYKMLSLRDSSTRVDQAV
jgi:4-amino-4-deoxy-L-arabinose transferase-like glycosyltransferase